MPSSQEAPTRTASRQRQQYEGQVAAQALDLLRREKMQAKVSVISAA